MIEMPAQVEDLDRAQAALAFATFGHHLDAGTLQVVHQLDRATDVQLGAARAGVSPAATSETSASTSREVIVRADARRWFLERHHSRGLSSIDPHPPWVMSMSGVGTTDYDVCFSEFRQSASVESHLVN